MQQDYLPGRLRQLQLCCRGIMCRGFRRSTSTTFHSCSNAHKSSTTWNRRTARTGSVDYQCDRRNVVSQVRTLKWQIRESVERCKDFNTEKKDRNPYRKYRWCEDCERNGWEARKKLLKQFGQDAG